MGKTATNFDLLGARSGRKVEAVLVISPYVERKFFDRLLSQLRPKRLYVVVDDGCRIEDESMIAAAVAAAPRRAKLACTFGSAVGLVHLKLFYIVWRTKGGRYERSIVFGSANATRQGFGGSINAELVASSRLTKTNHKGVIDWCEQIVLATSGEEPRYVEGKQNLEIDGVSLRLPGILVGKSRAVSSSFDLWVQRGYLLATYRAEPSFLKVSIHLKREFDETDQSKFVASIGFDRPPSRRLSYPYVGRDGLLPEDEEFTDLGGGGGNWRSRFFVWTQFGFWCSEQCYTDHRALFRRRGHEDRARQLARLKQLATPSVLESGRREFIGTLERLWNGLGADARTYLEGSDTLDSAYYGEIYDKRVARDLELVSGLEFKERYLTGFEIAPVPRFRTDLRGWQEFVGSMARQICLDDTRSRAQSRMLIAIRKAIASTGVSESTLDDSTELLRFLRSTWDQKMAVAGTMTKQAAMIANYHHD